MNPALLFKISIVIIIACGDAVADDKFNSEDMTLFEKAINNILNSHIIIFKTVVPSEIDPSYEEGEPKKRRGEKEDGLMYLPIRKVWSRIDLARKLQKRKEFMELKSRERQKRMNLNRIQELIKFMPNHVPSTKYLHGEVKRILRDREVYDELRKIIHAIEAKDNATMSKIMDECYEVAIHMAEAIDIWDVHEHPPNKLEIPIFERHDRDNK